jgi:DNA primase small subunit
MNVDKPSSEKAPQNAVVFSPELLKIYYARLFPYEQMYSWLSYSNDADKPQGSTSAGNDKSFFGRREWSFTIQPTPTDEIYIRYQSFRDCKEFTDAIKKRQPNKIDIGAVFSHPPKDHNSIKADVFHTEERELVFDIDLTDYDGVRTCCSGANICRKCWKYMNMAVKVMDDGLSKDFNFKNMVWFYSGRRGVHCWVCDESARSLSNEARSAVASYFEIPLGTENNKDGMKMTSPLHPMLDRAYNTLEPMFIDHIIGEEGMGLLSTQEDWVKLLKTLPEKAREMGVAADFDKEWVGSRCVKTEGEKWKDLKSKLNELVKGKAGSSKAAKSLTKDEQRAIEMWHVETVFSHTYPRLDINVSKMQNHLLKSPFCIHPKTGRVCVPLDIKNIDSFDPFSVPTLPQLIDEVDKYDREHGAEAAKVPDWKKTGMKDSMNLFLKEFLNPLINENKRAMKDELEKDAALVGEF